MFFLLVVSNIRGQPTIEGELHSMEDGACCWSACPTGKAWGQNCAGLRCGHHWMKEVTLILSGEKRRNMENYRYRFTFLELERASKSTFTEKKKKKTQVWEQKLLLKVIPRAGSWQKQTRPRSPDLHPAQGSCCPLLFQPEFSLQEAQPQETQSQEQPVRNVLFISVVYVESFVLTTTTKTKISCLQQRYS